MVKGHEGHCDVELPVRDRQGLGCALQRGRRVRCTLANHCGGRLHGQDVAVGRLVGAGARADVEHRRGGAQLVVDRRLPSRVRPAAAGVVDTEAVVCRAGHFSDLVGTRIVSPVATSV